MKDLDHEVRIFRAFAEADGKLSPSHAEAMSSFHGIESLGYSHGNSFRLFEPKIT